MKINWHFYGFTMNIFNIFSNIFESIARRFVYHEVHIAHTSNTDLFDIRLEWFLKEKGLSCVVYWHDNISLGFQYNE